ncbi:MAG: PAS domain-containing protein [Verrucomicrobia bacterium]|nr:PAS domain-containing protein [Verrucomicrobiota bacterium]
MDAIFVLHLIGIIGSQVLGVAVFWANTQRGTNRVFLVFSIIMSSWLVFLAMAFTTTNMDLAARAIQGAGASAAFLPLAFYWMRVSITERGAKGKSLFLKSPIWLALASLVAVMCFTSFYLKAAVLPEGAGPGAIPEPRYGPGINIYAVFYLVSLTVLSVGFVKAIRSAKGSERADLQFILVAASAGILISLFFATLLPLATGSSQSAKLAPTGAIAVEWIIAYGIATRRIMNVAHVLRRATAYGFLACYLCLIYSAVWWISNDVISRFTEQNYPVPHILATLAVAFSMVPAHGWMQAFSSRLFINLIPTDASHILKRANAVFQSITTMDDLLERFSQVVSGSLGTERVDILLSENGHYVQVFPQPNGKEPLCLTKEDPVVRMVSSAEEPIVTEALHRMRPTPDIVAAARRLSEIDTAAVVSVRSKGDLEAIMLLGPRRSGAAYGVLEQEALKGVSSPFGIAIENARLYTEQQNSKIYNDILVDNLISGVLAANHQRVITVFNREAQRITRLASADVVGRNLDVLPACLQSAFERTFATKHGIRDEDDSVRHSPDDVIPIRLGSAFFEGHESKTSGALVVFNDLTTIKKLEMQVRRGDRLASLGTLSAGMAHEIKNPLVTIKTFTDLLPKRYDDDDFRDTFSSLVGKEVSRIDTIVNQLLEFARPAKPELKPLHLHETIDQSLQLVQQRLRLKGITLVSELESEHDLIMGDEHLLEQAFLNFFLNALDAMSPNDLFSVTSRQVRADWMKQAPWETISGADHILVLIRDTGKGIPAEEVTHIFDPFFTTKSHGTGLGLSVTHGIIKDHHAEIDVESVEGMGTTFKVTFPLVGKEVKA